MGVVHERARFRGLVCSVTGYAFLLASKTPAALAASEFDPNFAVVARERALGKDH